MQFKKIALHRGKGRLTCLVLAEVSIKGMPKLRAKSWACLVSTVRVGRSHLFPTNTMGTSSESFTRLICSLDSQTHGQHLTVNQNWSNYSKLDTYISLNQNKDHLNLVLIVFMSLNYYLQITTVLFFKRKRREISRVLQSTRLSAHL